MQNYMRVSILIQSFFNQICAKKPNNKQTNKQPPPLPPKSTNKPSKINLVSQALEEAK